MNPKRKDLTDSTPVSEQISQRNTGWHQVGQAHRWMAAIVESSDDAIIGKNLDSIIVSCNEGATRLFGYKVDEMVGQSVKMLIPQELQNEESEILKRIKSGERIEHFETVRQRKDGVRIHVSLTISPVKDDQGKIIGASKIARDVTAQKAAEEKLQISLEREQAARHLAETASHAKDDFLAALSHELRTPLNPILLIASDAINDRELPPRIRTNFEIIRKNVELEARLIDDLLDFSSINRDNLNFDLQITDGHQILEEAVAAAQKEARDKQIEIISNLFSKRMLIRGDPVRLKQVFANVLKNALKYTSAGGKVLVETESDKQLFKVKIKDTGVGIARQDLESVFYAFKRTEYDRNDAHRFSGLGLGLAISRRIIELHLGAIRSHSDGRDKGATFTIELPLAEAVNQSISADAMSNPPVTFKAESRAKRILLVEDHEATRNALANLLGRRNYKVFIASSLKEAREFAGNQKIDFVISDIGLPDGDGNELMRDLNRIYGLHGIALTGYGLEQDVKRSLAAGFVSHLTKPVSVQSLEKALMSPGLLAHAASL
jgi:PAS domain S-box-containing protein